MINNTSPSFKCFNIYFPVGAVVSAEDSVHLTSFIVYLPSRAIVSTPDLPVFQWTSNYNSWFTPKHIAPV